MSIPAAPKKKLSHLLTALAVLLTFGLVFFALSEPGRSIGIDVFLSAAAGLAFLAFWVSWLKKNWHICKLSSRIGLLLLMGLALFTTFNQVVEGWPRLPWVKARAFTTVDQFMTDLNQKDYAAALGRLTESCRRAVDPTDLSQPDAQPVLWKLSGMDRFSNIEGMAAFSDGQAFPLMVTVKWSEGRWQIERFWFGTVSKGRLDYSTCSG